MPEQPTLHVLKCDPDHFQDLWSDIKKFEIRKNDRSFKVGDVLSLVEYSGGDPTGRKLLRYVTYITAFEQKPGWVVMGLSR